MGKDDKSLELMDNEFDEREDINIDTIYNQCNDHLKETDRKRDQILILFATITGLYIGNLDKLENFKSFKLLTLMIVALGALFSLVLIEYRLWHIKYALYCQVLQRLMFINQKKVTQKMVTDILKEITKPTDRKRYLKSAETITYNIYLAINFINIYVAANEFKLNIYLTIILIILYVFLLNFRYYTEIKNYCNPDKIDSRKIWILNMYTDDNVIYKNKYFNIISKKGIIRIKNLYGGCAVLPITKDNQVLLLNIKRPAINSYSFEIPRGFIEKNEDDISAAERELNEELHCKCEKLINIGTLYPDSGLINSKIKLFLGINAIQTDNYVQKEEGIKEIIKIPFEKICEMIYNDDIK